MIIFMRNNHNFKNVTDDESFTLDGDRRLLSTNKRGYMKIPEDKRLQLLRMIQEEQITIKTAAHRLGVNYSTAKNIVKIFRQEKRVGILPKKNWKPNNEENEDSDLNSQPTKNDNPQPLKRFVAKKTMLEIENTHLSSTNNVSPALVPKIVNLQNVVPLNDVVSPKPIEIPEIKTNFGTIQFDFHYYGPIIMNKYFIGKSAKFN